MTRFPEEDCVEKMLLNAPSGGYINYSPSIQVSIFNSILMEFNTSLEMDSVILSGKTYQINIEKDIIKY